MTTQEIKQRVGQTENVEIEYKSAKGGFPESFWETFSAFANTNGGIIVLGVKEKGDEVLVDGLEASQLSKYKKTFWDMAHNKGKVSATMLTEDDVTEVEFADGARALAFHVPRASYDLRPVHLTRNPFGNTFRRNHEGDYRCTDDEVRLMFADAQSQSHSFDGHILPNYTMDDIDTGSLRGYRQRFLLRHEKHPWNDVDDSTFLTKIGAYRIDRETGEQGFTRAGILMLGKSESITDPICVPNYFPDYRERLSTDARQRWSDRIYPDGTWEANLYLFFYRVYNRLSQALPTPFMLDGITRQEETTAHFALREALVNCLVHCNYAQQGNFVIERTMNQIFMRNPGGMLVSVEDFYAGGRSLCRNPYLQKMFMLLGYGEKAGSGADTIIKGWDDLHWARPLMTERLQPEETQITLEIEPHETEMPTDTIQKTIQNDPEAIQKGSDTIQKTIQNNLETIQKAIQNSGIELTESQIHILAYFMLHPEATRKQYLASNPMATEGGTISNITRLQKLGLLRHEGGRKNGHWVVIIDTKEQDGTD